MIGAVVRFHIRGNADADVTEAEERLRRVTPTHSFAVDMRSATAMVPVNYYSMVADSTIEPHHAGVKRFSEEAVVLENDEEVAADIVVFSVGSGIPIFPLLLQAY